MSDSAAMGLCSSNLINHINGFNHKLIEECISFFELDKQDTAARTHIYRESTKYICYFHVLSGIVLVAVQAQKLFMSLNYSMNYAFLNG